MCYEKRNNLSFNKEFKDIIREKVYIFAFLLQLFIVIGIVLIGSSMPIQTYVDDPGSQGTYLLYSEVEGLPDI